MKFALNRLTAYFGSLLKIPFEKAQSMAKDFQDGLSKCCLQPNQECIVQEVRSELCNTEAVTLCFVNTNSNLVKQKPRYVTRERCHAVKSGPLLCQYPGVWKQNSAGGRRVMRTLLGSESGQP